MFSDMDVSLREMGVGDLSVGRRMRAMWEAFNGRALAYDAALAAGDAAALEAALMRNVWRGTPPPQWASDGAPDEASGKQQPESCAAAMARLVTAQAAYLDGQGLDALAAGEALFLSPAEALP
jgi:cytochrome b pre-mRNA-processing protein 3